jgi:hypothetical protein
MIFSVKAENIFGFLQNNLIVDLQFYFIYTE